MQQQVSQTRALPSQAVTEKDIKQTGYIGDYIIENACASGRKMKIQH